MPGGLTLPTGYLGFLAGTEGSPSFWVLGERHRPSRTAFGFPLAASRSSARNSPRTGDCYKATTWPPPNPRRRERELSPADLRSAGLSWDQRDIGPPNSCSASSEKQNRPTISSRKYSSSLAKELTDKTPLNRTAERRGGHARSAILLAEILRRSHRCGMAGCENEPGRPPFIRNVQTVFWGILVHEKPRAHLLASVSSRD